MNKKEKSNFDLRTAILKVPVLFAKKLTPVKLVFNLNSVRGRIIQLENEFNGSS